MTSWLIDKILLKIFWHVHSWRSSNTFSHMSARILLNFDKFSELIFAKTISTSLIFIIFPKHYNVMFLWHRTSHDRAAFNIIMCINILYKTYNSVVSNNADSVHHMESGFTWYTPLSQCLCFLKIHKLWFAIKLSMSSGKAGWRSSIWPRTVKEGRWFHHWETRTHCV